MSNKIPHVEEAPDIRVKTALKYNIIYI